MKETIAIQGLPGSYTSMALEEMYPETDQKDIVYRKTFKDVFDDVKAGHVGRGIVAFNNTRLDVIHEPYMQITGRETRDQLWVDGGVTLPVNHCLAMPRGGTISTLKTVHTQEEARQQCDQFMYQLNGQVTFKPEQDTALSAEIVSHTGDVSRGAICSEQAALIYGLTIVKQAIQDDKINQTRFVSFVPYSEGKAPLDADNSLIALTLAQKSGSLAQALGVIAEYGVDLRTIKSRNIPDTPMRIDIITEMRIGVHDERMGLIVEELAKYGAIMHIIGSYKETLSARLPQVLEKTSMQPSANEELRKFTELQQRLQP